jgi:hypothetical protein
LGRRRLSVYGMGRFPVTLYKEQWLKLLDMSPEIRSFTANSFRREHAPPRRARALALVLRQILPRALLMQRLQRRSPRLRYGARLARQLESAYRADRAPLWLLVFAS